MKIQTQNKLTTVLIIICVCCILRSCYVLYSTKTNNWAQVNIPEELMEMIDVNRQPNTFDLKKAQEMARNKHKINYMKELIKGLNEEQLVSAAGIKLSTVFKKVVEVLNASKLFQGIQFDNTVFVIQVHGGYNHVSLFLESIRRVVGISQSLLIFAHDFYDPQIYQRIKEVRFARVMQIFYPYSSQLHPYMYPGEDVRFCHEWGQCIYSNERDPFEVQAKLFWWWVVNEVFDHIHILKNYTHYIYFLETEHILTNDFILVTKRLEAYQPRVCPECKMLSLGSRQPRPEQYSRRNSSLIVSVWGWSNYTNSGIGFNRTTWNTIKSLKREFCHYNDYTWEFSLRHLASKMPQKHFFMLSTEGPRLFLTDNCLFYGNRTRCDLRSNHANIKKFLTTISGGLFPHNFKLEFDDVNSIMETSKTNEGLGGWEDVRDKELCMFFASMGRRVYY